MLKYILIVFPQKAAYCSGEAVSGVQSVNFIVDCTDCTTNDATFQFRVYSESFSELILIQGQGTL